jgi:hypothetical protein
VGPLAPGPLAVGQQRDSAGGLRLLAPGVGLVRGRAVWRLRDELLLQLCPDLVGGHQQLADPGEDRAQHHRGNLLEAISDLRDRHHDLLHACLDRG